MGIEGAVRLAMRRELEALDEPERTQRYTDAVAAYRDRVSVRNVARAFEIGFLVFLPFLIIDLVVSAVLMSMGMMMVPPAIVALPFKLAFFVVADGWSLISGALVRSYF